MPLSGLASRSAASHKRKKLLGRGRGSGHGKTSTRGHKGQKSRSGRDFYVGFEGGQSPLIRRIPKRGFRHTSNKEYQLVNLKDLSSFSEASVITPSVLADKGLIRNKNGLVKILGDGELKAGLIFNAHKFSGRAIEKIEKAGGKAEVIKL